MILVSIPVPRDRNQQAMDEIAPVSVDCQIAVERRLRAPATASFAPFPTEVGRDDAKGIGYLFAYVDAQNGFGAKIRTQFGCEMRCGHRLRLSAPQL